MKVLLSSVFGPYGVDDDYGRKENIMELFHNQVTREQGIFSLRFNHQSFGLYFIAENIHAPATVLDFPSEKRFIREIMKGYDYVGISFIVPNFIKARRMAELVRQYAPQSRIVLGGHGTSIPGIEHMIEYDHICRGEGVKWFRQLLGEAPDRPFKHPVLTSAFDKHVCGIPLRQDSGVLIPGVGCPNACRFCCTSHFFDKKYTPYFASGKELFDVCVKIEKTFGYKDFFVLDENFLKQLDRAHELVQIMEEHGKHYRFGIFSSAETIMQAGIDFLARLGVYFVWIGVESKYEVYEKNKGIDLKSMIRQLRDYGISVLASGILFLEQHDKQSIWDDIRFIVDMQSDFVQFMQLGPLPGTALYQNYDEKGVLRKYLSFEEWHGQHEIWFIHPNFTPDETTDILRDAFRYDYNIQGSSLLRMCDTLIRGFINLTGRSEPYMIERRKYLMEQANMFRPILSVLRSHAHNDWSRSLAEGVIAKYEKALGPMSFKQKLSGKVAGIYAWREASRIATGKNTYQPKVKRNIYRMSARELVSECLKGKNLANLLDININWSHPILVRLEGTLDRVNAKHLGKKLLSYLKHEGGELILNLDRLVAVEDGALGALLSKIKKYPGRSKIVYKEGVDTIREAIAGLPESLLWLFVDRHVLSRIEPIRNRVR